MPSIRRSIRRSLRLRLQLWYALVLLVVVASFAGLLYYQVVGAVWREVDGELVAGAQYLDVSLRRFPPDELERDDLGEPPSRRRPEDRGDDFGPPPRRDDDRARRDPPPRQDDDRPPPEDYEDGSPPRRDDDRPPPREHDRWGGPPPHGPHGRRPPRERILAELELPERRPGPPGAPRGNDPYFAVWMSDGRRLKSAGPVPVDSETASQTIARPPGVQPEKLIAAPPAGRPEFRRAGSAHEVVMGGPHGTVIVVGKSVAPERARLRAFAWQLVGAAAAVLAVGLAGGWVISGRIFRPIESIAATAASISAAALERRIDTREVDDELAHLADVLNGMFARLQSAFAELTRFTADASHELRTPLAILQSHAELALNRERTPEEYRETIQICLEVAARMTALVDGLLTLARADAGQLELRRQTIDLAPLVERSVVLFEPIAAARQVTLGLSLSSAMVSVDPGRLEQVITNLVSNGIRYNRPGGTVDVSLSTENGDVLLAVRDSGTGIPPQAQAHLFSRFFRVDKARARASGGQGLGLAISKCIVEAHGGTIGCESQDGIGSTFAVRLPRETLLPSGEGGRRPDEGEAR